MTPRIFCHNDTLKKLWYKGKPNEDNGCHDNNAVMKCYWKILSLTNFQKYKEKT